MASNPSEQFFPNRRPLVAGGFFALGQALSLREDHARCVSLFRALRLAKRQNGQKQQIFSLKTVGIHDAIISVGVVLGVATTSFWGKAGSETIIPVVRHNSSGWR